MFPAVHQSRMKGLYAQLYALLPELQPAPCFLSAIIGQID